MKLPSKNIKKFLVFLLSHHTEEYAHRTLRLKIRTHEVRLCARCSGLTLGFFSGILVLHFWWWLYITEQVAVALIVLLLMPALLDWGTQSVLGRESKNWIRVTTGFSLGFGICLAKFINLTTLLILVSIFYLLAVLIMFKRVRRESRTANVLREKEISTDHDSIN
ncbi:MAG: DUF2085 domain-containing protein [Candidatus Jordarchaeales archaeon]